MEHVQLEEGFNNFPRERPYHPLGPLTTRCWVRSLWELLDYCGLQMTVYYLTISSPRTGDKLLADIFVVQCKEQSSLIGKVAIASKLAGLQR